MSASWETTKRLKCNNIIVRFTYDGIQVSRCVTKDVLLYCSEDGLHSFFCDDHTF